MRPVAKAAAHLFADLFAFLRRGSFPALGHHAFADMPARSAPTMGETTKQDFCEEEKTERLPVGDGFYGEHVDQHAVPEGKNNVREQCQEADHGQRH